MANHFLQCVRQNWFCATYAESRSMFVFAIFVREFLDESSGRNSFKFLQALNKILFSELNIFRCSIIMHYVTR